MKKILLLPLFFSAFACKQPVSNNVDTEIGIINDCFLSMVDTVGYHYHTLRPGPRDSLFTNPDSLGIGIFTTFTNVSHWSSSIEIILKQLPDADSLKKVYLDLYKEALIDTTAQTFDPTKIARSGKYILSPETDQYAEKIRGRIGVIVFSRVYYTETKGLAWLVATFRAGKKTGVAKLFLSKKQGFGWAKISEYQLEVW
jgi:hypothetical protein